MSSQKEVLTIDVKIEGADEIKGATSEVCMIYFTGTCNCELFEGVVLPGGIDTQMQTYGSIRTLSARYILEGKDYTGEPCRIFIENSAKMSENEEMITQPRIITNSKALAYLETSELVGTIDPIEQGVCIHIMQIENEK